MAYVPLRRKKRMPGLIVAAPVRKERDEFTELPHDVLVIWWSDKGLVLPPDEGGGYKTEWSAEEVQNCFDWGPNIRVAIAERKEALAVQTAAPIGAD